MRAFDLRVLRKSALVTRRLLGLNGHMVNMSKVLASELEAEC
jgi:hypothetical protein